MTRRLVANIAVALAVTLALLAMPRQVWSVSAAEYQPQVTTHQEANDRRVVATSAQGRPIVARHYGAVDAPVQLVVIGQMHGSEPGGRAVVAELASRPIPDGVGIWLLPTVNPDGHRRGTRVNAHGVDLNRNFPERWDRSGRGGPYWSGGRAASEPETRGIMRFLQEVQPTAVLSFHQAFDLVDVSQPRGREAGRQLARWMGERADQVGCPGPCHGTMTQWIDRVLGTIGITVELDRHVSGQEARRAAGAVLRLGTWLGR